MARAAIMSSHCAWTGLLAALLLMPLGAGDVAAQSKRDESTFPLQVQKSSTFEVQGNPQVMIPGLNQTVETPGGAATYELVTNTGVTKEIRASLDEEPPAGLSLEVKVEAPKSKGPGAASAGWTALSLEEEQVVSGIKKAEDSGASITYRAEASESVAPGSYTITVKYTLTEGN